MLCAVRLEVIRGCSITYCYSSWCSAETAKINLMVFCSCRVLRSGAEIIYFKDRSLSFNSKRSASLMVSRVGGEVSCSLDFALLLAVPGFNHAVRGQCTSRAFRSLLAFADERDFLRQLS